MTKLGDRFDRLEERLDEFRTYVDGRFERIDNRLDDHSHNHHGRGSHLKSQGLSSVVVLVILAIVEALRQTVGLPF